MGGNGSGHVDELDESEEITDEDRVTLVDEDGNEHAYVLLAEFDVDGQAYVAMAPEEQLTDDTEDVELLFLRVESVDEETEQFVSIESEDEFNAVRDACAELLGLDEDEDEDEEEE